MGEGFALAVGVKCSSARFPLSFYGLKAQQEDGNAKGIPWGIPRAGSGSGNVRNFTNPGIPQAGRR